MITIPKEKAACIPTLVSVRTESSYQSPAKKQRTSNDDSTIPTPTLVRCNSPEEEQNIHTYPESDSDNSSTSTAFQPSDSIDTDSDDDSQLVEEERCEEELEYEILLMDGILGEDYDGDTIENLKKLEVRL